MSENTHHDLDEFLEARKALHQLLRDKKEHGASTLADFRHKAAEALDHLFSDDLHK